MSARTRQSANGQVPPADPGPPKLRQCWCSGYWLDDDEGRHAHSVVFLHQPETREAPARESAEPEGDT